MRRIGWVAVLLLLVHLNGFAQAVATVAAASDLKFALDDLIRGYEARSGHRIRAVYGSSGNLARQIEQGAPFDVFMSADEAFVDDLARKGLTDDAGSLYGIGRIVLYSSDAGVFAPDASFDDLRRALARGRVERFAIANPEHAPYGRAAREALMATGLWTALSGRLVLGENVSQAAQFAVGGNAQGGVFALSLALAPTFPRNGSYVVVPESLHAPLRQKMVVLKRAPAAARTFHAYLRSPEARAVLERHGFTVPGN